jgi:Amt family ammonium transporter
MSALLFPLFGRWTWGGGWLTQLGIGHGFVDFAGAGVLHAVGGLCALAGCLVLGPRIGKYGKNGIVMPVLAHNVPLALAGSLLLALAWLALHCARALTVLGVASLGMIAVVTLLAGTGGAVFAALYTIGTTGKPDPTLVANGLLAGLVASSGSAAFVGLGSAFVIGAVAGLLACLTVKWLDRFQIDDPVGAVAIHGVGGLWGVIAVGLFANGESVHGLFHGDPGQLLAQLVGCAVLAVWAFGVPWLFFTALNRIVPMRVAPEMEREGLDVSETGVLGYPDFQHHSEEGRLRW